MEGVLESMHEELLRRLVTAARSLPVEGRTSFLYCQELGAGPQASLVHPGLSGSARVHLSDLQDLADLGLLRLSPLDSTQGSFDITVAGYRAADQESSRESESQAPVDPTRVWVIYGRDKSARNAMFDFLRSLELRPMEWNHAVRETGKGAPFVGEVLDVAFARAQAFVVLLTGDDEARLRPEYRLQSDAELESRFERQPRPNVLFEAGMAFGAHAERTVIVQIGDVKPFSDIAGRHLVRMDGSAAARQALAGRLQTAGCTVNTTGTDWLTAGDFHTAVLQSAGAPPTRADDLPPRSGVALTQEERRVLRWLSSRDPHAVTVREIVGTLGGSEEVMTDVLTRLDDNGMLQSTMLTREGQRYRPSDRGRAFLRSEDS